MGTFQRGQIWAPTLVSKHCLSSNKYYLPNYLPVTNCMSLVTAITYFIIMSIYSVTNSTYLVTMSTYPVTPFTYSVTAPTYSITTSICNVSDIAY